MASSTNYFNKNFLLENYNTGSQRGYGDSFHNLQEGMVTLGYLENVREQVNASFCLNSNNYASCNVNQSKVIMPTLEINLRNLSIKNGNNISDDVQKTKHAPFIQGLTFDFLPDDAFITIKQSKPIHNIALFISFNYDLNNRFFQQECNAHGFHALFREIQDHVNIVPIAKLITDVVINCWSNNWDIIIFITSEPILPISTVTTLLKLLRVYFDQKILDIVIIWPNVYKTSRPWIDEQCRVAKATACIQGIEVSDIVPQIMSYFDNGDCNKEINGTTALFDEKKITICYHEFNNSYPAAMRIDDKIWPNVKHYFHIMKSETEKASLMEINSHDRNILLENILRKALYNKFSQHSRLKHILLSTRIASICFTQETCQCNLHDYVHLNSKNTVKSDTKILKAKFINILEEVRYNLIQEERERIKSEHGNLMNKEKNLFLL
ncbi:uncharacterized protein OCT59_012787 [Rhizophagus irregularis]|uniref:Uncharacterized protein n=4 Tax=Rhizophagus irregularis TaxID=588596 RepID=A0A015N1H6_RHIIW|nr:hypothetical protein RirG_064490 [Rhizophagus irregularis DAOM 197198w]UZO20361.1 hypothetical protein OCT59_012787 [Rhizophagus irregularis]